MYPLFLYRLLLGWSSFTQFLFVAAYYAHTKCFGTGDCIIAVGYLGGGFLDEYHRWQIECGDGEAMIGIYDAYKQFQGINQIWCAFMFAAKPPSNGIYPFFPTCNVRNLTQLEYYCYDKYFPSDTADTFITGIFSPSSNDPMVPTLMKCCKTPPSYKIDYNRCQWKYTHDKAGEHYDGYWIVKCDTHFIMTGLGSAMNPWDNVMHYVWIQCCPVVTVSMVPTSRHLLPGTSYNPYNFYS